MPVLPTFLNEFATSVTFVDYRGQKRSVIVKRTLNDAPSIALAGDLVSLIAQSSNAVVFKRVESVTGTASIGTLVAFDEAESSANLVGVLVFRRANNELDYVEIPAVDAQFIDASGDALVIDTVTPNTMSDIVDAFLAINPTALYERSFIATRKGTRNKQSARPQIAEPSALSLPGDAPGI